MKLLYTINEVFADSGYLKEHAKEYYNIPLYQRGYKWSTKEVVKLLDDINGFNQSEDKFYCLQNITIVPNENYFNVVDGQQRLSTLTLFLSSLGETELVKNKLKFPDNSIRTETNNFISEIIIGKSCLIEEFNWDDFITENEQYDHQDIFHLFHAYQAIDDWFLEDGKPTKNDFKLKLVNSVKLIINKIDTKNDEEEIFGNLNSKRIPLDGADLFRAILITRVASEEGKKDANIKDIIQLNEKRIKIGWEFDVINNWWSQDYVKSYFENFISIKEITTSDLKLFDTKKHPINLLLFLFAESQGEKQISLDFIERYNNSALSLYKKILTLHSTLADWFEDREIYHFLGYLFSNSTVSFKTIWDKWGKSKDRIDFKISLKNDIKKLIFRDTIEIDFTNETIDWYNDEKKLLIRVLILLDVISSLDKSQPFMNPSYFIKSNNDIEHIFPQNPEDVKDKKEFIDFLNKGIAKIPFDTSEFEKKSTSAKYIEKAEEFIQEHIGAIHTNSIGNLVFLYYSLNRSIGRSSYTIKRSRVIDYFNKGKYIQPHTFRVFVRYFNDHSLETKELEHWTNKDIIGNAKAIDTKVKDFFNS